ncbi:MAG: DinB family protein [Blastocatellales bacterium]
MREHIKALRYLISALTITAALGLVGFAQQTAPKAVQGAATASPAPDPIATLVADWTRARDYTKEYLDAMPEDGLAFKPTPDIRSFAEQMIHLAGGNFGFIATATGIANPYQGKDVTKMEELKTKAGLTKFVMESYDFVINAAKGVDLKKSGEPVKLFGRFETTRGGAWSKSFEHQTHHRGQTTIYLRLKGIKPPNEKLF